jgi:uncharacterized membrane protein HdeD (DUF308 family)
MNFTAAIVLARAWWTFVLRGIIAILFGLVAFILPGIALVTLVALFAAWLLIDGVAGLATAWSMRGQGGWWVPALEGVAGLLAGALALIFPGMAALALLYLVAFWSIVTGIVEIWAAIRLRQQITGELFMAAAGLISVLFGLYLVLFPGTGILSLLWLVGIFAVLFGIALIGLGWRLRGIFQQARRQNEYAERGMHP